MPEEEIKIEEPEQEEEEKESPRAEKKNKKKIIELEDHLAKAKADADHWKNEYYRAYADTKNLRNKLEKDYRDSLKYRVEGFVDELLPILDSFQSVLSQEVEDPNLKNYLIGFQYVYKNLLTVLENEGVTAVTPNVGDKFNPGTMDAIDTVESEKENIVMKVYGNGYKLHDRLIRPAKVQVSVLPKVEENKDEESKQEETLDA